MYIKYVNIKIVNNFKLIKYVNIKILNNFNIIKYVNIKSFVNNYIKKKHLLLNTHNIYFP